MSVVGFDIGSQSCYIAIARHGGVEMVNNEYSDRACPSIVGLGEKRRTMGTSARNQLVMNPKSTLSEFKYFVGRSFSDPYIQKRRQSLSYDLEEIGKDGGVGIKVPYGGEEPQMFTPEQIMGMLMTYLKKVTENSLGKPVGDCVISVPSFYTDGQRRALLDASSIAGLTCLRLMNDTTATALAYGIYKQDLPEEKEKPRNVAFVDVGHTSTQVAICSFQKGKLKVLSKAFDPYLGGHDFTERLVTHFKEEFSKRYKLTSLNKPRPTLRLFNECEKLKKNLSANTTSIPINIDCLSEDKDVSGHINREIFNELCSDLLARVRKPLEDALNKSCLKVSDIESVEVVGGSCRVPAIKDIISDVFKKDLSTTLNMDEAVARGCALQCAMLSPTFKVRDFSISDIQPYPIRLQWQTFIEGEDGEMIVFKEGDSIYHSKVLSFYRKKPFDLVATYQFPSLLPCPSSSSIGTFSVKDVKPTETGEASKIKVKVRMNIHGVFFIKSAHLIEKVPVSPEEAMETDKTAASTESTTPAVVNNSTDTSDVSQGSEENQPPPPPPPPRPSSGDRPTQEQPMEDTPAEEQADTGTTADSIPDQQQEENKENGTDQSETTPTGTNEGAESEKQTENEAKPTEAKKPKKPTIRSVDLPITNQTASLTKKELDNMREKEVNMNYQDELEQQKKDAKNAVEEYVYEMRDKLSDPLAEFVTDKEKEDFSRELTATEDWLYDEGEDQPKKVYVKRLEELKKTGDMVVLRELEWRERPRAFEELASTIIHYEKILTQYKDETNETYRHIEEAEMKKVEEAVNVKRAWMNTKQHAASNTPKHINPTVKSSEIRAEGSNLENSCKPIVSKPKPKIEPPKDTAEEKKDETQEGTETAAGEGVGQGGVDTETAAGEGVGQGGVDTEVKVKGAEEQMEDDPPKGDTEDMDLD